MKRGQTFNNLYGAEIQERPDGSRYIKIHNRDHTISQLFFRIQKAQQARELAKVLNEAADIMDSLEDFDI